MRDNTNYSYISLPSLLVLNLLFSVYTNSMQFFSPLSLLSTKIVLLLLRLLSLAASMYFQLLLLLFLLLLMSFLLLLLLLPLLQLLLFHFLFPAAAVEDIRSACLWAQPSVTRRTSSCRAPPCPQANHPHWTSRSCRRFVAHPRRNPHGTCNCWRKRNQISWQSYKLYKSLADLKSCSFFLIVDRSMGALMILRYVGNCLVFTGNRNGHESSWSYKE